MVVRGWGWGGAQLCAKQLLLVSYTEAFWSGDFSVDDVGTVRCKSAPVAANTAVSSASNTTNASLFWRGGGCQRTPYLAPEKGRMSGESGGSATDVI